MLQRAVNTSGRQLRHGFSMIELLVVMTIVAFLFGAVLFAMGRSAESARIAGTKTLLRQLDAAVQDRLEAFNNHNFRSEASAFRAKNSATLGTKGLSQVEVIVRKIRYREMLPQRIEDLYGEDNTVGSAASDKDNSPLYQIHQALGNAAGAADSSELLYLALTRGPSYGGAPLQLDDINQQYIADTDGDGLLEFVDGWGNPLRFYNAPTALLRPANTANEAITSANWANAKIFIASLPELGSSSLADNVYSSQLNRDPQDPLGDLQSMSFDTFFTVNQYHTLNTYYTPLIVSAGQDESLGLDEPGATGVDRLGKVTNANLIYDNLTNRQGGGL